MELGGRPRWSKYSGINGQVSVGQTAKMTSNKFWTHWLKVRDLLDQFGSRAFYLK